MLDSIYFTIEQLKLHFIHILNSIEFSLQLYVL